MKALIDAAINRAKTTMLVLLMVVLAGLAARSAIPISNDPNIQVPFFVVTVFHEGISPEDAERLLLMPLEIEVRNVEGVEEMTGFASEGAAYLMVEFEAEHDLDQALSDLREAVDRARPEMPDSIEEPVIREASVDDFPILQINLVGNGASERLVYNLALELRDQLETVPNILDANIQGHREELLEAVIDPQALEAYQISNDELINTLLRNNRLIAAGSLDTGQGRFSVKVPSLIEEAQDLFDLPVKVNGDTVVTLADVATVRRTFKDRAIHARVNGATAISIDVIKRANANVVDTINLAKAVVVEFQPRLPKQVDLFYTLDQSPWVQSQVTELQGNIFTALALVMILVVAAMGVRSGLIVGLGIPASLLFSLIFIYLLGYTYNFMVMFGMLLGLGMLIDGAIVVTEYADRKMTEGFDRRSAYALSAKRMFWPVAASVATTLAAFLPMIFWPGIPGKFMRYLPVTVFTVLSGSLLYALVFGPVLGSLFGRPGSRDAAAVETLKQLEDGDPTLLNSFTGLYARLLRTCTRHAVATILVTVAIVTSVFVLYGQFGRGLAFFSDAESKYAVANIRARGNLSTDEIDALVREVEEQVLQVPDIQDINVFTALPGRPSLNNPQDVIGTIFLEWVSESERDRSATAIMTEIRQRTDHLVGLTLNIRGLEQGPPTGKPIKIEFASHNKALLDPAVARTRQFMESRVAGLRDIEDTRALPGIEWRLRVDRAQAALYGADVFQVGVAVQLVTNGLKVGEYRPSKSDDAVDIRVRYPEAFRRLSMLDELKINTNKGLVPISNFVQRTPAPNVDSIQRVNGVPVKYIRADVAEGVLADDKVGEVQAWLGRQDFGPGLSIRFRGTNEEQAESIAFVSLAFSLSLLLMFILLVTQFNSFYQSVLILFSVVLSTAGVLVGLLITNGTFSAVLTGVGVVALAGIVVNNNIVLIDTYNHLRREHPGLDPLSIIVRTGAQRLRPVMLTTVTTVFGLLPLASNLSIDLINREIVYGGMLSAFWVPMSQAIVWGLSFATLLTLVATPAMLALPYQLGAGLAPPAAWLKAAQRHLAMRLRRAWRKDRSSPAPAGV